MSTKTRWIFWPLAAVAMLAFLGTPPVQRTQEARVMETARQMPGHGWRDWMVPHLNGHIRLQKPPLAYWMAAAGFGAAGVNDFAGRTLFAACGLGSLIACYQIGRMLFDRRVAAISAGMLLSTFLFFRFSRSAETDSPAALLVTSAIALLMWPASLAPSLASSAAPSTAPSRKRLAVFHLAAVAMALAGLAKGPPLFFPIVFLVFASVALRSNLAWRFVRSGAPITLLVIVLPWYVFIIHAYGWTTFLAELHNNVEGNDHGGSFFNYAPWLLMGLLPWTAFTLLALIGLGQSLYRGAPRELKLLTAWILAIALPLMLTGNKQSHYLLPLMPPLMVLTGWFVSLAIFGEDRHVIGLARAATLLTAGACVIAGVAAAVFLHRQRPGEPTVWLAVPALIAIGGAIALLLQRRSLRSGVIALIAAFAVVMPLAVGYLSAKLMNHDPRQVAAEIRGRFGASPLVFYGPNLSLSLCYNLRQTIPTTDNAAALLAMQKAKPNLVAIAQDKAGRTTTAPPPPFIADGAPVVTDDQVFTFYRVP